jgi:AMMECR1 domain-containing protein
MLGQEIIANAISAAINDPRFDPVREDELADLRYSVDVLRPAEETTFAELNPAVYGVIVEDEDGLRRGLLLPDMPGVKSTAHQVEIAARKAGIPEGTPVKLWRFKVDRYREEKRT